MVWALAGWLLRVPAVELGCIILRENSVTCFAALSLITALFSIIMIIALLYELAMNYNDRPKMIDSLKRLSSFIIAIIGLVLYPLVQHYYYHETFNFMPSSVVTTSVIIASFAQITKDNDGYIPNILNGFALSSLLYIPALLYLYVFHIKGASTPPNREMLHNYIFNMFIYSAIISLAWRLHRRKNLFRNIPTLVHGSADVALRVIIMMLGLTGAVIGGAALWYGTPWVGWFWNYEAPGDWIYLKWAAGFVLIGVFLMAVLYLTQGLSIALKAASWGRPRLSAAPKVHGAADYGTQAQADAAGGGAARPVGAHQQKFKA